MDKELAIAMASILITVVAGFIAIGVRLGRLELKIDTIWDWWLVRTSDPRAGGRRHHDPPAGGED